MPLVINKNGKQLGPYSLEEARALVLSGELDADDWAWPDNATTWVQLKDVPGFAPKAVIRPTAPPAALAVGDEEELWRGHPAQVLNLGTYLFWSVVLIVAVIVGLVVASGATWGLIVFGVGAAAAIAQISLAWLHLRAIEYVVTTQRVRVISGLLSKDISEIELFRVKDTSVHQSFFLRLFGLGTITVVSGDERHPRLVLAAVPNAVALRERLRSEVMALRQRFGVRELDVM
jgi:membrane protein YdbS with pleckstrin-like domain